MWVFLLYFAKDLDVLDCFSGGRSIYSTTAKALKDVVGHTLSSLTAVAHNAQRCLS